MFLLQQLWQLTMQEKDVANVRWCRNVYKSAKDGIVYSTYKHQAEVGNE